MGFGEPGQALPTGVVTFLLSDVEGSTRLWESAPDKAGIALARQLEIVADVVAAHGGAGPEEQGEGDSAVAVFASAVEAVAAAVDIQRAMASEAWPADAAVRVRIGVHSGEAHFRDARNYTGPVIHRCARLRDIAHGGQTLLSAVTATLAGDALPPGAWLADLGEHRLRDLSRPERVFGVHHEDLAGEFPPLRSLDVVPNNLPAQLTSFVGREDELAEVESLVDTTRLVTLTGSGGCGKTRLAVQVVGDLSDRYPDGVWWVDLAPLSHPDLVAEVTASTIGVMVEPKQGPLRALSLQLRDRRLLLCLDNCEHLLDPVADLVTTVLSACPAVTVLATSREAVNVPGEVAWRVPSMLDDEAHDLFAERAIMVRPGFAVDDYHDDVTTICERLDGIPLAIELAAARVRAFTPAQIAAGLEDRFRLLAGGRRGVTSRHQTLAASIDWSHDLLDDAEQVVFRRLAVFAGGCTVESAQTVCTGGDIGPDAVVDVIAGLVDKSLVVFDDGRYRLLDTIRQYTADRLEGAGETVSTLDRHLDWFLDLAEQSEPRIETADQDTLLERLETDYDNIRAALDWGLSAADPERGRRLAAALWQFWAWRGHTHDGIDYSERAIALAPDEQSQLQARLLCGGSRNAALGGRLELALTRGNQALAIASAIGDDRSAGRSLTASIYALSVIDLDACRATSRQSRELAEAAGDDHNSDLAQIIEASAMALRDRHHEAAGLVTPALARSRQRNDRPDLVSALWVGGISSLFTGDVLHGCKLTAEAFEAARPLRDYFFVGQSSCWLALAKAMIGDIDAGRRVLEPVSRAVEDAGPDVDVPLLGTAMGLLGLWEGDLPEAERWLERGTRWGEPFVDNAVAALTWPPLASVLRRTERTDEAHAAAERALELAQRLGMPRCMADTLDEAAFLTVDDPGRAEDLHHQALALRVEHGLRTFYVDSLDALARCAAHADSHAEAARLLAASDAARDLMGYPRPPVDEPDHEFIVGDLREALGEAFDTTWAEGAALSRDEAVAYATRARGTRARPSSGWASLTPSELDVARLAAEGLTNPQIATKLFISRSTVKTHLSHIYAKLDITNRTELAAVAASRAPGQH